MKTFKLLSLLVLLSLLTLTSCTDKAEEVLDEKIEKEKQNETESYIDPKDVKPPTNG